MTEPVIDDERKPDENPEAAGQDQADTLYGIRPGLPRALSDAFEEGDEERALSLVEDLHAADLADLIELLPGEDRRRFLELIRPSFDPDILPNLSDGVRDKVIAQLGPQALAEALTELDSDDALFVIEDLDETTQQALLASVPAQTRLALEEGLTFPEYSAGRLMQRDLVAIPAFWTVGQAIDYLRATEDLPDDFYELFIVDPKHKPIGTLPLSRVLRHKRLTMIRDIMDSEIKVISAETDQEEVGFLFRQYSLASAPVVDDEGRLIGVITFDDAVEVIQDEAEEDIALMAGVGPEVDVTAGLVDTVRQRFTWLLVNLGTAVLASAVIAMFDATIEKIVALAVLMPIVASMGGNAGTQTLTVAVRAMALKELNASNAMRILMREVLVGGWNGILFAALIGVAAGLYYGDAVLAGVLAAAMVINMLVAGLSGMLVPLALARLKIDPAVAASVFLTTITDVIGFFAFLGLAHWILL